MINLLAIDTSFSICSVAVRSGDVVHSLSLSEVKQSNQLLTLIDEILRSLQMTVQHLTAIAVGCGPGSFTGIRVAVSVAQGLGYALNLPIIPVSSLAILAQSAYERHGWTHILTAVDARMQEIYWAAWTALNDQVEPLIQEQISAPNQLVSPDLTKKWYGVGDAWDIYAESIYQPIATDTQSSPLAVSLLSLAFPLFNQGKIMTAKQITPVYLRDLIY